MTQCPRLLPPITGMESSNPSSQMLSKPTVRSRTSKRFSPRTYCITTSLPRHWINSCPDQNPQPQFSTRTVATHQTKIVNITRNMIVIISDMLLRISELKPNASLPLCIIRFHNSCKNFFRIWRTRFPDVQASQIQISFCEPNPLIPTTSGPSQSEFALPKSMPKPHPLLRIESISQRFPAFSFPVNNYISPHLHISILFKDRQIKIFVFISNFSKTWQSWCENCSRYIPLNIHLE